MLRLFNGKKKYTSYLNCFHLKFRKTLFAWSICTLCKIYYLVYTPIY